MKNLCTVGTNSSADEYLRHERRPPRPSPSPPQTDPRHRSGFHRLLLLLISSPPRLRWLMSDARTFVGRWSKGCASTNFSVVQMTAGAGSAAWMDGDCELGLSIPGLPYWMDYDCDLGKGLGFQVMVRRLGRGLGARVWKVG
ncbi:unnamed protein product [Cuscuta europaea]|uniref:Uncharacterized protein n=1 Tax=Cuscuta europaea TaxID=41803 RepID=A0A9P0ZZK7_CUSEU|nr:unnamed protein product [Cuscuta europaea]